MKLAFMAMRDVPEDWHPWLSNLTIQSFWAMSRWLYQDGSCWVVVAWNDTGVPQGWACLTCEDEPYPVLGAYVKEEARGKGYATACVSLLLDLCKEEISEREGAVYASSIRWPKYKTLIERAGFEHWEWE